MNSFIGATQQCLGGLVPHSAFITDFVCFKVSVLRSKLFNLPVSHLSIGDNNSSYLIGLLGDS